MAQASLGSFKLPHQVVDNRVVAERWTRFRFLLHRLEQVECNVSRLPSSQDTAAAVLFALMEGRASLSWCCANSPLGPVCANSPRTRRFCRIICSNAVLHDQMFLPPGGIEPLLRLCHAEAEAVITMARGSASVVVAAAVRQQVMVSTPSPPAPLRPAAEVEASGPAAAALTLEAPRPARFPQRLPFRMMQLRALETSAAKPPMIDGMETSGPIFSMVRGLAEACVKRLHGGDSDGVASRMMSPSIMAVLVWGDPTSQTELNKMHKLVPGGVEWEKKETKLRQDFSWVYQRATKKKDASLYWHDAKDMLFVFHCTHTESMGVKSHELELDLVKGDRFIDAFPPNSPERLRVRPWEDAIEVGTVDALLNVSLTEHYTLWTALKYGMTNYENRHGQMHVKKFFHEGISGSAKFITPDGRELKKLAKSGAHDDAHARLRENSSGEPLSPKRALIEGLIKPFAPFAARLYYASVQGAELMEANPAARLLPDVPFSYYSVTLFADKHVQDRVDIPGLAQKCNGSKDGQSIAREENVHENGDSKGMDLHTDERSGYTIVLVLGALLKGFTQLYPSSGVGVPLACYAWTSSNARDLLHAVSSGSGFRIGLVYTVHTAMATGITSTGHKIAFDAPIVAEPKGDLELTPAHLKHLVEKAA